MFSYSSLLFCYSSYDNPTVPDRIVRHEVHKLISRLDRCLAKSISKDRVFTIAFFHDVYRMLFGDKLVLNKDDFCTDYFSEGWYYNYRKIGGTRRGRRIVFPIRCRLHIVKDIDNRYTLNSKGKLVPKSKGFREMLRIRLGKENIVS